MSAEIPRTEKPESTTRVDAAHPFDASGSLPPAETSHPDLLTAIAGTNSSVSAKQLKGQTLELAAFLQKKQELLDRRESELNARLAMLESESRATRLRCGDHYAADEPSVEQPRHQRMPRDNAPTLDSGIPLDEDQRRPACTHQRPERPTVTRADREPAFRFTRDASSAHGQRDVDVDVDRQKEVHPRSDSLRGFTPEASPTPSEPNPDEQSLTARIVELNQREEQLQGLHDQVVELHREALELRVAAEQTLSELSSRVGDKPLAATLSKHRGRLTDHYKLVSDELSRRRENMHQFRDQLAKHESELRRQRLEVQMWVDRQRNELEAKLAEITVRESEVERREVESQRDTILWQKQREDYRQDIELLGQQLRKRSGTR